MPITSITLKNVASYDNSGVTINNLKKLNLFVGSNGTGKSTIARCIYNYSLQASQQRQDFHDCVVQGFNPSQEKILVYDEEFKQSNFVDTDKMKGVFSLNSTNAEIDSKITAIETEIDDLKGKNERLKERERKSAEKEQSLHTQIVNSCFDIRRHLQPFSKVNFRYGGSKEAHFNHLLTIPLEPQTDNITLSSLQDSYNKLFDSKLVKIDNNIETPKWEEVIEAEKNLEKWLSKIIVGHDSIDISKLIQKLNMSTWVDSGRRFLANSGDLCPFCQQPLNNKEHLVNELNLFFDEEYRNSLQSLRDAGNRYYSATEQLKQAIRTLQNITIISKLCYQFESSLNDLVDATLSAVREKLEKPNECINISSHKELSHFVEEINALIANNNEEVNNLSNLQKQWEENCWKWMRLELNEQIDKYNKKKLYIDTRIKPSFALHHQFIDSRIRYGNNKINELRQQTVNTRDAVDAINIVLKNVGFSDFVIEEVSSSSASSQYRLKRISETSQSNVYKSLSEGEKTFISFLYFHQLCVGTDNPTNASLKKIIVIDDPISSLDNRVLFIVASIIHRLDIQKSKAEKNQFKDSNISQIFVLTHNLYFYKEISFSRRPMCQDIMHYRIYKDIDGNSQIENSTKAYPADDYSILWSAIKENKDATGVDERKNIMLCNAMRRIIDSYCNFIGISNSGGNPTWASINRLDTTDPIYIIASSFISQINDDSHGVFPLDSSYYGNIVRQDSSAIYSAFKLIFDEIGPEHYKMMISQ